MKRTILLLLLATTCWAQAPVKTVRASQFPGTTLTDRINAAQVGCSVPNPCIILIDEFMPKTPNETLPSPCSGCTWQDLRTSHVMPATDISGLGSAATKAVGTAPGTVAAGDDSRFSASGVPSGMILFIDSGSCPSGWTELGSAGNHLLLTIAANGDVGTTGGSNSYTPAGSSAAPTVNSLTAAAQGFTGDSTTVGAQSFTGDATTVPALAVGSLVFAGTPFSSIINHTHTVNITDPGHVHTLNAQGGTTASTTGTHLMTSTATGGSARAVTTGDAVVSHTTGITAATVNPSGGVASITPAGSLSGSTATGSLTPLGHNTSVSITPLGHNASSAVTGTLNAGAFTGTPATIQPTYLKLIGCRKQ